MYSAVGLSVCRRRGTTWPQLDLSVTGYQQPHHWTGGGRRSQWVELLIFLFHPQNNQWLSAFISSASFLPRDAMIVHSVLSFGQSVCLSVNWLNVASGKQCHVSTPTTLAVWCQRSWRNSQQGATNRGVVGYDQRLIFDQYLAVSQKHCNLGT